MWFNNEIQDQYFKRDGDKLGYSDNPVHVPWFADIVSIDGAHYHFWLKPELKDNKEGLKQRLNECKRGAHAQGDPVSFSYSFIPDTSILMEEEVGSFEFDESKVRIEEMVYRDKDLSNNYTVIFKYKEDQPIMRQTLFKDTAFKIFKEYVEKVCTEAYEREKKLFYGEAKE